MDSDKQGGFFDRVYQVVRLVPYGRVTTYGAIARYLGSGGSARMVGWAMNASCKTNLSVPAHRVVNRNGLLTGKNHFQTPTMMEELLVNEGIEVQNDCVKSFQKFFWDPMTELE